MGEAAVANGSEALTCRYLGSSDWGMRPGVLAGRRSLARPTGRAEQGVDGMELRDYLAALRRHWPIWVGATLVGVLAALVLVAVSPRTYEASSRVFVAVSPEIPNSAAFVQSRVKSYPDVVSTEAVLAPVIDSLDLPGSLSDLRGHVRAVNPVDTSAVLITVSGPDPDEAADIANAVAARFADRVEELETPASGDLPVALTVSDPAVAPSTPVSPVALYIVTLGLLVGLFLGLAGAVVRSRTDTTLHGKDDVRRSWGEPDPGTEFLVQPSGRARRSALTGQAANTLARRLELRAEEGPVRVVVLSPSPAQKRATRTFAEQVSAALADQGLDAVVTGPDSLTGAVGEDRPRVRLDVADPLSPLRVWKHVAKRYDGVVLVVAADRVEEQDLGEMRTILRSAGIVPLAVVLVPRGRRQRTAGEDDKRRPPVPTGAARRAPAVEPATSRPDRATQAALSGAERG